MTRGARFGSSFIVRYQEDVNQSAINSLQDTCSAEWENVTSSQNRSRGEHEKIAEILDKKRLVPADTSFVVFGSLALANILNTHLDHSYLGYLIVGGVDILMSILLILWVLKTKIPLLTSLFVKILVNIFNIRSDEDK